MTLTTFHRPQIVFSITSIRDAAGQQNLELFPKFNGQEDAKHKTDKGYVQLRIGVQKSLVF